MGAGIAFKCANCGRLEGPEHAGENREIPAQCRVCGAGVHPDPATGKWVSDPENWIKLADLPEEELAPHLEVHGLTIDDIVAHTPTVPDEPVENPQNVEVAAEDSVGTEDLS